MYCEDKYDKDYDYAKDKASKGTANTGVVLGAIGTGLGVLNSGILGGRGLFGRGGNCDGGHGHGHGWDGGCGAWGHGFNHGFNGGCGGNCFADCKDLLEIERQFTCVEKQFAGVEREIGHLALGFEKQIGQNALYQQSLTYRTALESQKADCELAMKEACDVRDLYRYNDKVAYGLNNDMRNANDKQQAQIDALKTEVAIGKAIRPYQDKLIDERIREQAMIAAFNLERRTCRMITGEVVMPLTPTVTGVASLCNCGCGCQQVVAPM